MAKFVKDSNCYVNVVLTNAMYVMLTPKCKENLHVITTRNDAMTETGICSLYRIL